MRADAMRGRRAAALVWLALFGAAAVWPPGAAKAGSELSPKTNAPAARTATYVVAAADADARLQASADFVCPGSNDHLVINAAVAALPAGGGRVHLTAGTFSIGGVAGTYGGISIFRSNVLLTGEGCGTRLILQDGLTDINVVWIKGDISNVAIRDLYINGNGTNQAPWVRARSGWQGGNGVKAIDRSALGPTPRNIRVENCRIEDCQVMAVMLSGTAVEVLNCYFTGDFGSHVIELLGDSGRIEGCTLRVKDGDRAAFGFSTDASYNYHIINNKILIEPGGTISAHPINNWPSIAYGGGNVTNLYHGIIAGNIVVNNGTTRSVLIDGYMDMVNNNIFRGVPVVIGSAKGGGGVTFEHNLLINSPLEINCPLRGDECRIYINGNQFFNSSVKHVDGHVVWGMNPGYATANAGLAAIPAGQTAVTVEHGLSAPPAAVQLTPANRLGAAARLWVDGIDGRSFTVNAASAPEAAAEFHWRAAVAGSRNQEGR